MWKLDSDSPDRDTYLYIDEYENKYAIGYERKGVRPKKYPDSEDYKSLDKKQEIPSSSPLKFYNTVIFSEDDNDKKFIGFHLTSPFILYSADSTGSPSITIVVEALEQNTGDVWKLYNY